MKAKHKLTKADWDWLNGRQAAAARPEAEKPGTDTGTPETRRKLTSDHLRKLLEADKLTQDQYDAALEIGEALHRITAPVSLRISNPAREVFSRGDDGESVRAARIVNRYLDWCDAMVARKLACRRQQDKRRWLIRPILDVCEGATCYQVEREHGMKSGAMLHRLADGSWGGRLIDALDLYLACPRRERPQNAVKAA